MTFAGLVTFFVDLVKPLVPIIMTLSLVVFFVGLARFISKSGDSAEVEKGRQLMFWGVFAFFVMFSVWGLVGILGDTFSELFHHNDQHVNIDPLFRK